MFRIGQTDYSAYFSLLSVVILWGASFAVSKFGLYELSPLNLAGARFSVASVIFGLLLIMQKSGRRLDRQDILTLVVAGFMAITSYFYIQYTGLLYTSSVNAALLLATSPVWTTIFCVAAGQEQITARALGGILLAFVGISLVISKGKLLALFASDTIYGDLLLLLNALVWAGFTLYGKRIMQKYPPFSAMAYIHIFGSILLLPVILIPSKINPVTVIEQLATISLSSVLAILYLAILCSVYGFGMWYRGISQIGALRTASFYYISPLFALIAGIWLLNESFSFVVVIGGLMVIAGVYLTNKYKATVPRKQLTMKEPGS
ncbi:MAG: EamA family transporter [Negativicutes bacterium]|nr:EamA family transporter [Negativicutes bacterium]